MNKLVLIDGHSILNRAFFGLPDLTNNEGLHTNAIYGFLNILFKIMEEEKPDYLTVAFDVSAPTFRHKMYPEYKGTRKPMAEELKQQVPIIKEVLLAMGIKIVEMPGFEADDVLGTLAKRAQAEGIEVSLVSGDRDLLQISDEHIKIRIPKTKNGKTEIENYYPDDVREAYGVDPHTFIQLKALMGDTADNIPGVPKIGQKTASDLLITYGSLDAIFENLDQISKKSIKESLSENRDKAYFSLELATIKTDVDIDYSIKDAKIGNLYTDEAYYWFKRLEFKNFLNRFETKIDYDEITKSFGLIDDITEADSLLNALAKEKNAIGLSLIYDNKTSEFIGISVSFDERTVFIRKWLFITEDYLEKYVFKIGELPVKIYTYQTKKLYELTNIEDSEHFFDPVIAEYLLNPIKSEYLLTDLASEYLGMTLQGREQLFNKKTLTKAIEEDLKNFTEYACYEAYILRQVVPKINEKLVSKGLWDLYINVEMPLTRVLYDMERAGIKVVPEKLLEYSKMLGENLLLTEKRIYLESGCEFNINSPKQLGEILFEKMGIPGGKKTKTGYSTAADVLEKLSADYPVVKDILSYRAYSKLKSTYADGLTQYIDSDNRIHSTFHQTITATGRLSSADPNLQNIPIRMDLGRQIRKVFVPEDGYIFMDADYSQIELRVLASLAQDETLINAYSEHADIHRITASLVFHIPFEEVTDLQRRRAKAVNFGIVYGISAFGLGEDLGISPKEAKEYMEEYFATYPKIKSYLEKQVENAKRDGYTRTYYGRIRPIPELSSSNFMQRSFGERVAMNSPIQGTAADIIKIAMNRVHKRLKEEKLKSRLILQVHDELLIEVLKEEEDQVEKILREEMIDACDLRVRMEIDLHTGNDWYEAK